MDSTKKLSNPTTTHSKQTRKRTRVAHQEKDAIELKRPKSSSSSTSHKKPKSRVVDLDEKDEVKKEKEEDDDEEDDDDEGVFVIEKIIGERIDEDGQMVYKVLWVN